MMSRSTLSSPPPHPRTRQLRTFEIGGTRMNRHLIAAGLAVLAASAFGASDGVVQADVVIYGSSPAAISAVAGGSPVQDVPYATLRKRLVADGQVIELAAPVLAAKEKKAGGLHLDRDRQDHRTSPGRVHGVERNQSGREPRRQAGLGEVRRCRRWQSCVDGQVRGLHYQLLLANGAFGAVFPPLLEDQEKNGNRNGQRS